MFEIFRYLIERLRDLTAKRGLEQKLGRKVSASDIYSLKTNLEAATGPEGTTPASTVTKTQVPLTTQDYETLKAVKGGGLGCFMIFVVLCLVISTLLYLLITDEGGSLRLANRLVEIGLGIIVVPFSLVLILVAFLIFRRYRGKASRDIRLGKKNVVTSQVVRQFKHELDPDRRTKFANTTAHLIEVAGIQYDLKEEDYAKFAAGMEVEVHTAINSGEFLGIYDPRNQQLLCNDILDSAPAN